MAGKELDKRQNVSISDLLSWSETNPNRSKNLTPIEVLSDEVVVRMKDLTETKESSLSSIRLDKFESINLTPSGMLSAIAFMSDKVYQYSAVSSRNMFLRELATKLQQDTDNLAGSSFARKRKKVHDGIATLANGGAVKPEDWIDIFSCLAFMTNIQLVFVQMSTIEETKKDDDEESENDVKHIYFSSNPSTWTREHKIWIVDYYGRWVASPKDDVSIGTLTEWLEDIEIYGWNVHWHIDSSLKKEELVQQLSLMPSWQKEHEKLKKDTLAIRLAKMQSINKLELITQTV